MFEELYDNLEVVDARQTNWQSKILKLIGAKEPGTDHPLRAILNLAQQLGVKTAVLESSYIDKDFLDEFRNCYVSSFRGYDTLCKRIHFFNSSFTKKKLPILNLVDQGYLGFSVVRPTRSFCSGRTILISPKHNGDAMFTLCKAEYEANLAGNKLSVTGMPFIQQDTNVGVCAQAAIWMAGLYMHRKFGFPRFTTSEITSAATKSLTIGPVRHGLVREQIITALKEMGYMPVIFTHYDESVTNRIIYAYVESELPAILLIQIGDEGHAVVVGGHDFHCRQPIDRSWESNIYWIDRFYIHDDAFAPYDEIMLRGHVSRQAGIRYSIADNARYIIVPVFPAITMQANDVFDHLDTLMERLNALIDLFGPNARPFSFSNKELTGVVFRTYLRASNDFKAGLSMGMSEPFRHRYKSMRMPRYVWVTEVSKHEHINKARSRNRKIIGEIIIDSTADRHAHMASYLAIHLLGRMIIRHPKEDSPYALYIDPSEKPYGHLVR